MKKYAATLPLAQGRHSFGGGLRRDTSKLQHKGLDDAVPVRGLFAQSSLHKAFFMIKYIQIIYLVNE